MSNICIRIAGNVSMKHNYAKILALDYALLYLYLNVDKLVNIFSNDC